SKRWQLGRLASLPPCQRKRAALGRATMVGSPSWSFLPRLGPALPYPARACVVQVVAIPRGWPCLGKLSRFAWERVDLGRGLAGVCGGVEQRQLAWLLTARSAVQIRPPRPRSATGTSRSEERR